jgi:hypothetical protein
MMVGTWLTLRPSIFMLGRAMLILTGTTVAPP